MSSKEVILSKYRRNIKQKFDMPSLDDIKTVTYPDPLLQFTTMTAASAAQRASSTSPTKSK